MMGANVLFILWLMKGVRYHVSNTSFVMLNGDFRNVPNFMCSDTFIPLVRFVYACMRWKYSVHFSPNTCLSFGETAVTAATVPFPG